MLWGVDHDNAIVLARLVPSPIAPPFRTWPTEPTDTFIRRNTAQLILPQSQQQRLRFYVMPLNTKKYATLHDSYKMKSR